MKSLICIVVLLINHMGLSQVVINELDSDTPSIDTLEFVELKSNTPNFSLDHYVLVFFNGSSNGMNTSYHVIDLGGYKTDLNGLLLIGSNTVSPLPQLIIDENTIQNGADAVAIYRADATNFELETTVAYVDETLIDVLLYQTNDSDGAGLISIFSAFNPNIQIVNEGPPNNTHSIQRNSDGSYTVTTPTPRQLNDGSGIVSNGITISVSQNQFVEGAVFEISFTTEQPVTTVLNFEIGLNNNSFNASDYTGNTFLSIPVGQNSTTTTIALIDDASDEGDEVLKISYRTIPPEYLILNSNLQIRVIDNDFTRANFGTPLHPTYQTVGSTQPYGFYNTLDGLSEIHLKQALQNIIANPNLVRAQTYADIIAILKQADQHPENSNQVWLLYTEQGRAKLDFQTTSNNLGTWNREHLFPRSLAGYNSIEADEIPDGKAIYWTTHADSLRHGNSDAHAIRAADGPENSSRKNQFYGQYNGPDGNTGSFYGDVARSVFYLAIRYNGLRIINGFSGMTGEMGDLETLLSWHHKDPPDDFEMHRNNIIYSWQFNRNPFVDLPELVEYIWGNKQDEVWNTPLPIHTSTLEQIQVSPNPTVGELHINGYNGVATLDVFSVAGQQLGNYQVTSSESIKINLKPGMYILKIKVNTALAFRKIIVL